MEIEQIQFQLNRLAFARSFIVLLKMYYDRRYVRHFITLARLLFYVVLFPLHVFDGG